MTLLFFYFQQKRKNTTDFFQIRPTIGVTPEQPLAISTLIFRALVVARAIELRLLVLVLPVELDFDRFRSFGVLQKIVATRSKIDIVFILHSFSDSNERERVC